MTVINSNISSLNAQAALATNARGLEKAMQQLSTGKRINSAADDAAGLAIASKFTAQIRGLNQSIRNANDGISMLQTAEGALNEVTNMLQRMRELKVQALNGTNSPDDVTALESEATALGEEITRIGTATLWNGEAVLDETKTLQIGSEDGDELEVVIGTVPEVDETTGLDDLDTAIADVNTARSDLGAVINRLQYTVDNLTNVSMNAAASRSRIEDTDYSLATTELAKRQIIQQAATAMLAQANQQPQAVLTLLK